jgi:methylmalonyl-CoA mutase
MDESIVVEPYTNESREVFAMELPAQWEMAQRISGADSKQWNQRALDALMGGCNALIMAEAPAQEADFIAMMDGVFLQYIHLHIERSADWKLTANALLNWCSNHQIAPKELRGSFGVNAMQLDDAELKSWTSLVKANFGLFRGFVIDARQVHNDGGSTIQEIAFALTEGHAVLVRCLDAGLTVDEATALLQFNFATGSSYFAEIAKYRAFRWAWKSIVERYKPQFACSVHTHIQASTSRYTQTAKDAHNNLLRATTQAMSAIVGGVNGLLVEPYNSWNNPSDEAAMRWSRNIQQLLTEESYFEQFRAAANGSHYVESLTGQVLQASWAQFQQWDAQCASHGYDAFVASCAQAVKLNHDREIERLTNGERIVVGVNKYVNKADTSVVGVDAKTLTASLENS